VLQFVRVFFGSGGGGGDGGGSGGSGGSGFFDFDFSAEFSVGSAEGFVKFVFGLPAGPFFFLGRPSFFFGLKYCLNPFPPQYLSASVLLNIFLGGAMLFCILVYEYT